MVVDVETRAGSETGVKMARACDACRRGSRASWYCPADDAFLCQSCDASVHSANQLAKRHERVRLQSSPADKTTSVWYEGFRRKARTPRNKFLQIQDVNFPLVPELGGEDDRFFSFSSTDENEESLNCCVPVFDPFSDMMVIDDDDDDNSFGLVPGGGAKEDMEKAIMEDDGLIGFLPLDMDLTMDVESLLEEEQHLGVKEEDDLGFEINKQALKRVKDEERKMSLFLRLDYEAVITAWGSHGSPWKAGIKPEISYGDCWPEGQLGGYTCPSHVISGFEVSAVGSVTRKQGRGGGGGSDGEREARVLRYKEKRRTRLFAKKIRYEVRKLNAEQRPRIKGRFVKRTSL